MNDIPVTGIPAERRITPSTLGVIRLAPPPILAPVRVFPPFFVASLLRGDRSPPDKPATGDFPYSLKNVPGFGRLFPRQSFPPPLTRQYSPEQSLPVSESSRLLTRGLSPFFVPSAPTKYAEHRSGSQPAGPRHATDYSPLRWLRRDSLVQVCGQAALVPCFFRVWRTR